MALVVAAVVVIAGLYARAPRATRLHVGEIAPDFTLPVVTGGPPFRLSEIRGGPNVLFFFDTQWPGSDAYLQYLERMHRRYFRRGLRTTGVALDSDFAAVRRFVARNELTFAVLSDPFAYALHQDACAHEGDRQVRGRDPHRGRDRLRVHLAAGEKGLRPPSGPGRARLPAPIAGGRRHRPGIAARPRRARQLLGDLVSALRGGDAVPRAPPSHPGSGGRRGRRHLRGRQTAAAYRATGYPETFVIGRDGTLLRTFVGPAEWDTPEALGYFRGLLPRRPAATERSTSPAR